MGNTPGKAGAKGSPFKTGRLKLGVGTAGSSQAKKRPAGVAHAAAVAVHAGSIMGQLSQEELDALQSLKDEDFSAADINGDGRLSMVELIQIVGSYGGSPAPRRPSPPSHSATATTQP